MVKRQQMDLELIIKDGGFVIKSFNTKMKLEWLISENWNQQEISQRGKLDDFLVRKKVLLLGAGCVGASVAEVLVRAGVYDLTIADSDKFEIGICLVMFLI